MCEPPESRKGSYRRQLRKLSRAGEESGGQNFRPQNDPLATFVSFCWHEFGEALSMVPTPWRRRAPPSMTKRSMALQFFCHSFVISLSSVSSAVLRVKNEQEHEQEYEFMACIRVHSWLKTKISVDIFQRIPLEGEFTSGPPREKTKKQR